MPDGDIVHTKLQRIYQEPYKWLCEGTATSDQCARILLKKLKLDIKNKGDFPLVLSQVMAVRVSQVIDNLKSAKETDFVKLSIEFDTLILRSDGRPDLKELTLRAGKSFLHDLRNRREVETENAAEAIFGRYIQGVCESEFQGRIPLTFKHHAGVTQETLEQRITTIKSTVDAGIQKFAKNAIKDQTVARLSLPRRSCQKAIDLDEDLLGS